MLVLNACDSAYQVCRRAVWNCLRMEWEQVCEFTTIQHCAVETCDDSTHSCTAAVANGDLFEI
jgi:hypothetical protein